MAFSVMVNAMAGVNATIDIDEAANVEVFYSDTFEPVILENGVNNLELDDSQGSQLAIFTSASDITFSEITVNGAAVDFESKEAWIDITEGMKLVIRTQKEQSSEAWIYVDKTSRVSIVQNAGYGESLSLYDGSNTVDITKIQNPLKISATDGNELTAVRVNGEAVDMLADGTCRVQLEPGKELAIYSRVIPKVYSVNVAVSPEDYFDAVKVLRNKVPVAAANSFDVEEGDRLLIAAAKAGYEIEKVVCNGSNVEYDDYDEGYTIAVTANSDIQVNVKKTAAEEGYAFVNVASNDNMLTVKERDATGEVVRTLNVGQIYEVKIGNTIEISNWTKAMFFRYVKCNGKELTPSADNDRLYTITVDGECAIEAETYMKVEVSTYETYADDELSMKLAGNLMLKVPGSEELVNSIYLNVGETVTLVPIPAIGYIYDYAVLVTGDENVHYTTSYTVTEEDLANEVAILQGVFSEDTENPTCVLMGNKIYGEGHTLLGYVKLLYGGEEYDQITLYEGDKVHLNCYVAEGYECVRFTLWNDQSVTLDQDYTVNSADANSVGVIDISAELRKKDSGVESIEGEGDLLEYDAKEMKIKGNGLIRVFSAEGLEVASGEDMLDLSALPGGIYVAVSGSKTLRFIRR